MIPQSQERKPRNSSKVNLTISAVFHALLIGVLIYFAARQGYLGRQLKEITVYKVKEEKPPAPPPVKPAEPPKEIPKPVAEPPKLVEMPKVAAPPVAAAPVAAPPANDVQDFAFSDGAKAVNTESDPVQLYKGYLEYELRARWNRPEDLNDADYAVEVAVDVDPQGNLKADKWLQGSGNPKWDASVQAVFAEVKLIDRRPPTNFPPHVVIRFDTEAEATEPVLP